MRERRRHAASQPAVHRGAAAAGHQGDGTCPSIMVPALLTTQHDIRPSGRIVEYGDHILPITHCRFEGDIIFLRNNKVLFVFLVDYGCGVYK